MCRSQVTRWSFVVRSVSVWNSLPSRVIEAGIVECFKRILDVVLGVELPETIWVRIIGFFLFVCSVYTVRMYIYININIILECFIFLGLRIISNVWSDFLLPFAGRAHWRAAWCAADCLDSNVGFKVGFRGEIPLYFKIGLKESRDYTKIEGVLSNVILRNSSSFCLFIWRGSGAGIFLFILLFHCYALRQPLKAYIFLPCELSSDSYCWNEHFSTKIYAIFSLLCE